MVPPDSKDPETTSSASAHHGGDLTLNEATPAADVNALSDLRLGPEVDLSSAFESEHALLERRDIAPPDAPSTALAPGVESFVTDEADRSWLSRWRSMRSARTKAPLPRSAEVEPVAPTAPPVDGTVGVDQRLGQLEAAIGRSRGAAIDEAFHDLCAQMHDRLVRVEAAVQRTEDAVADQTMRELCEAIDARLGRTEEALHRNDGVMTEEIKELSARMTARFEEIEAAVQLRQPSAADSTLRETCTNIERELAQTREALQRTEDAAADKTLHELCRSLDARLARTEETLHRSESAFAEGIQELSARMNARFAEVEKTLQLPAKSIADSMLPNIERQLMQARASLQRTEEALADKTTHELCQSIHARLEGAEERLHRNEGVIAQRLQDLSARMTAQFAETEKAIQRIERIGIGRTVEPFASPQIDDGPVHREEPPRTLERSLWDVSADVDRRSGHSAPSERETRADQVLLARASVLLDRLMNAARTNAPMLAPWIAKAAVTVLVVVAAFSVGSLMRTGGDVAPGKAATPIATSEEASAPVAPTVDEEIAARPTTLLTSTEPRSARESESAAPQLRSPNQEATTTRPAKYVGTLSITSVPSGAKVSINGKPAGVTPLRLSGQRAGSLAVQIAHDGFERWSAAVLVPADRLTQVSARLRATPR